jgi:hypothetical protein
LFLIVTCQGFADYFSGLGTITISRPLNNQLSLKKIQAEGAHFVSRYHRLQAGGDQESAEKELPHGRSLEDETRP